MSSRFHPLLAGVAAPGRRARMVLLRSVVVRRVAAIILLPCYLAGCHRWVPSTVSPVAAVAEGKSSLRVTLSDSTRLVLRGVTVVDDSVVAYRVVQGQRLDVAVALSDIAAFEVTEGSTGEAVAGVAFGLLVGVLVVLLVAGAGLQGLSTGFGN